MNIFTVNAHIVYDSVKVALIWLFIAHIASYASGVLANQKPMESHATIRSLGNLAIVSISTSKIIPISVVALWSARSAAALRALSKERSRHSATLAYNGVKRPET